MLDKLLQQSLPLWTIAKQKLLMAKGSSVHENQPSRTSWALVLTTQVCFAAAGSQSPVLVGLDLLAVMQGEACAPSLKLNSIFFLYSVTVVEPFRLDTALVGL